jgi:helicase required for RNAi-mediated heterochromatin assembly 1
MLRPASNGVYSSRPPPSTAQVMLLDSIYQTPSNPAAPPMTPESSASVTEKWEAYVNGGAAVDDAHVLRLAREKEARYLEAMRNTPPASRLTSTSTKLIQVSPEKKAASKNTNLLIDLDIGSQPEAGRAIRSGNVSYAKAASLRGKGTVKADINLLD